MAALPPPPPISRRTIHIAGILVDVYGLAELKRPGESSEDASSVTLLWLHHPRLRAKEDMADIAARAIAGWNDYLCGPAASGQPIGRHGLVALAFDQRNHGTRLVEPRANEAWRQGNPTHAQDMFGIIAGTVADTRGLMDMVEGYLFADGKTVVTNHVFLGVSLGGHSGWQLMFTDERVKAAVLVVGCPDFMGMCSPQKTETYGSGHGTLADGCRSAL